jgi:hypothetical protein
MALKIASFTFEKAHFRKCRMKNITDYLEKEQVDEMLQAARSCRTRLPADACVVAFGGPHR